MREDQFHAPATPGRERLPPRSKVHTILRDRAYIGEINHGDQWYPGKHEPIIDRPTWDRVQVLLGGQNYHCHALT